MVDWTLQATSGPHMVDLSGGQPDLTPEWPLWFLRELDERNADHVYVWSDDNLSTDHLWTALNPDERAFLGTHRRYGRACCIKGYNEESFAFNTLASPDLFERQLTLLRRLREESSIDFYVYLTITTPTTSDLARDMSRLVDRLQEIHEYLPLRCVPLKILEWGPVTPRLTPAHEMALVNQFAAVDAWAHEISHRFPGELPPIEDVPR